MESGCPASPGQTFRRRGTSAASVGNNESAKLRSVVRIFIYRGRVGSQVDRDPSAVEEPQEKSMPCRMARLPIKSGAEGRCWAAVRPLGWHWIPRCMCLAFSILPPNPAFWTSNVRFLSTSGLSYGVPAGAGRPCVSRYSCNPTGSPEPSRAISSGP